MLRASREQDDESEGLVSHDDHSVEDSTKEEHSVDTRKTTKEKINWKTLTSKLSKVDQDSLKTIALLALVLMVLIRLATIDPARPVNTQANVLRSSKGYSRTVDDAEDMYDYATKPNLLQQQSALTQNALMQQQQLALAQAQQQQAQQQILMQAQAQKNAEDQLRSQQQALQQQQGAIFQQQQQQNHQALMMHQQTLLQQQQTSHMAMMQALGSQMLPGTTTLGNVAMSNGQTGGGMALIADSSSTPSTGDTSTATSEQSDAVADAVAEVVNEIPLDELDNFQDTWDPYNKNSIPIYWHIPKAGGSTVKDTIGACFRMVMATEFGITDGHDTDTEIAIVYPKAPGGVTDDRSPFVNVDTSTPAGIERAAKMGFADSHYAGCVVSPFIYESNALFTQTAKGRLFAVFRHPVDRAVSMFYYIQVATWEPSYKPELQSWTLKEYAESAVIENNWMTRQLSNQLSGELDDTHLQKALEVVRRKFMVGLMKQVEKSMARFERYYRWTYHVNPTNQEICRERLTSGGSNSNSKNKKEKPKKGEETWELLAAQNVFDIQLYEYIEILFDEQEQFVEGIPDDFRKIDGTCCKCDPPTFPPEGFECPKKVLN